MERVLLTLPLGLLGLLAAACWWLTVAMAIGFDSASAQVAWQEASLTMLFLMWAIMMAAMMLPSFFPTLRIHQRLCRRQQSSAAAPRAVLCIVAFAGGYLALWLLFSVAAALLQHFAAAGGWLSLSLAVASPAHAAALLAAAGLFQFSRLKMKCLHGCRHPAFFFLLHWRGGVRGAWRMGVHNGLLCLGCCGWLMLLLFVGGVMDLTCILLLTLYVLAEKTLPVPPQNLARAAGVLLLAAAAWQLSIYV